MATMLRSSFSAKRVPGVSQRFLYYHELSFDPKEKRVSLREHLEYHRDASGILDDAPIRMLAAPWNPADHMTVMGTYPKLKSQGGEEEDNNNNQSPLAFHLRVAGHEGWGQRLCDNEFVVPHRSGTGTLRSHYFNDRNWIPLRRGHELYEACGPTAPASLFQTAGTAIGMLRARPHEPGDCIIQNAGNSAVGVMVSQWAALKCQLRPISLVRTGKRSKESVEEMRAFLKDFGKNEHVFTEEEVQEVGLPKILEKHGLPQPVLGVNAAGGPSASRIVKALSTGAALVTYGGMTKKPINVSAYHLIFKNITCMGYWHSRWMGTESTQEEKENRMNDIVDAVLDDGLQCPPHEVFPLAEAERALQWDQSFPTLRKKIIFDCREVG